MTADMPAPGPHVLTWRTGNAWEADELDLDIPEVTCPQEGEERRLCGYDSPAIMGCDHTDDDRPWWCRLATEDDGEFYKVGVPLHRDGVCSIQDMSGESRVMEVDITVQVEAHTVGWRDGALVVQVLPKTAKVQVIK